VLDELPHVRTELLPLLVIPAATPHPEQSHRQFARHGYFGDGLIGAHRDVCILMSPWLVGASYTLCRLAQQESQQRMALLTEVAQTQVIGTGVLSSQGISPR
jgi:hypothetical protein